MNIESAINLILTVPFFVLLAILSLIFLLTGYKNGLWRSLVSLGASLAALLVSIVLGKVFGGIFAETAFKFISRVIMDAQTISPMVETILRAALQTIMSLVFFGIFLIISVPVLKFLAKKLRWSKVTQDPGEGKGGRLAGMGIRFLDAVILTFLFLLPLYGSVAATVPAAAQLAGLTVGQTSREVQLLSGIAEHPMVSAYRVGPAAAIYNVVGGLQIGDESFDIMEISDTLEGMTRHMEAIENADSDAERLAAVSDFTVFLREDFIETDWAYSLFTVALEELEQELPMVQDAQFAQQMYDLLNMSKEEFQSNGIAILDFMNYVLNSDFVEVIQSEDLSRLDDEFYQRVGDLINHSEQAVGLKKLMMTEAAANLFYDVREAGYEASMVKAHFFLEQFVPNRPTDPALRKQEGEMFMLMYFSSDSCDTLAAFAHHPNIGYANVQSLCTGALVEDSISFESYAMYDANTMAILQGRLAKLATDPFPGYTFRDYTTAVCALFELLRNEEHDYYFKANAALLEDLLQDLNDGFFQSATLDSGRVKALLEQALTEARQTPDATGTVCIYPVYTGEATTVFQPYPHREVYSDFVLIPEG